MKTREYERDYYPPRGLPWFGVGCAAAFGLWYFASGYYQKFALDGPGALTAAIMLGLGAWAVWGARQLLDREPQLSTDRDGLTAHRRPEGPIAFTWDEIVGVSLDARRGAANAVLVVTTRDRGKVVRHAILIGRLDADPGAIYDHVLKCHTAARPVSDPAPEPDDEPPADEGTEAPVARAADRPEYREFAPVPRFPIDARWVSLVLVVVGLLGIVLASDSSGRTHGPAGAVVAVSCLLFVAGLVVGIEPLRAYGLSARPPAGWPRLALGPDSITYSAGPDDELEIAWDRVRNVVWVRVTDATNVTVTTAAIVYYLARRGAVRQLRIVFEWWQDGQELMDALREHTADEPRA